MRPNRVQNGEAMRCCDPAPGYIIVRDIVSLRVLRGEVWWDRKAVAIVDKHQAQTTSDA